MVGNATNWTYVDMMREPSGSGILRAVVQPYLDALGGYDFLFYGSIVAVTMGIAYNRTNDIYAPLFVLLLAGTTMTTLLSGPMKAFGTFFVALSIAIIFIIQFWIRRNR